MHHKPAASQDAGVKVCGKFQIKTHCFVCERVLNFHFLVAPNSSLRQSHDKGGNLNTRLLFSTSVMTAESDTLNVLLFKAVSCCALWPRLCQSRTFKASSLCQLWVAVYTGLPRESRLWWIEWKRFWSFMTKSKKREGEDKFYWFGCMWNLTWVLWNCFHKPELCLMATSQKHRLVKWKVLWELWKGNSLSVSWHITTRSAESFVP